MKNPDIADRIDHAYATPDSPESAGYLLGVTGSATDQSKAMLAGHSPKQAFLDALSIGVTDSLRLQEYPSACLQRIESAPDPQPYLSAFLNGLKKGFESLSLCPANKEYQQLLEKNRAAAQATKLPEGLIWPEPAIGIENRATSVNASPQDHPAPAEVFNDCGQSSLGAKPPPTRITMREAEQMIRQDLARYWPYAIRSIAPAGDGAFMEDLCRIEKANGFCYDELPGARNIKNPSFKVFIVRRDKSPNRNLLLQNKDGSVEVMTMTQLRDMPENERRDKFAGICSGLTGKNFQVWLKEKFSDLQKKRKAEWPQTIASTTERRPNPR